MVPPGEGTTGPGNGTGDRDARCEAKASGAGLVQGPNGVVASLPAVGRAASCRFPTRRTMDLAAIALDVNIATKTMERELVADA